ncbi:MAG: hypothetical protein KME27_25690 [Lyngbya sp. HA4199-MV5]|nr:hypothetical protein [Lyngbya sp. HA4199-MV5]
MLAEGRRQGAEGRRQESYELIERSAAPAGSKLQSPVISLLLPAFPLAALVHW